MRRCPRRASVPRSARGAPIACSRSIPRRACCAPRPGLSLRALNEIFPARGWASPVSPGTQYVTLGGMVASDVHGKNHHVAGCFGEHVRALRLRVGDGRVLEIDEASEPELFRATLGGMGLTGHLLEVELQLERIPSFWIWRRSERVRDLDELLAVLRAASARLPFTAAWVDTTARGASLGRGIVTSGRYAEPDEAPATPPRLYERVAVPFDLPGWFVGPWSIRRVQPPLLPRPPRARARGRRPPAAVLLPARRASATGTASTAGAAWSSTSAWCPGDGDAAIFRRLLEVVSAEGGASPVSVIKDCGAEGRGMLSFPMPGMSLALDLPYRPGHTRRSSTRSTSS